ncbi:MAG: hypothetical protein ACI9QL_005066 [Candidatus Omnitrophota bacterium]|jgi:hypothetical protein
MQGMPPPRISVWMLYGLAGVLLLAGPGYADPVSFDRQVRPILSSTCYPCHGPDAEARKGKLRLDTEEGATNMLGLGHWPIKAGEPEASEIITRMLHDDPDERMPPEDSGKAITPEQIELIRTWIAQGAVWEDHWAFQSLKRPEVPKLGEDRWSRNAIDAFIRQTHLARGLAPAPEADRLTMIRRLYVDLTGLLPSPEEIDAFVDDPDPAAYEKLVKHLLASPHHGERWARHWLDVVKYADTHGYDKDKLRPNAWPYRDYVIRSLNADKPYAQFVREQLAGDVFAPGTSDGLIALGFIAAGPWDFIGHAEVPESKIDGQVARNLDRDDMVCNALNTFTSLTIQCARCHDHKFDPFTQEHYYSLQAVFAAIDRADREVDVSEVVSQQKAALRDEIDAIKQGRASLEDGVKQAGGGRLKELNEQLAEIREQKRGLKKPAEHGWHSQMVSDPNAVKWVQLDLGTSQSFERIVLRPCYDDFGGIGAGFGFPIRFKVETSDDPDFAEGVHKVYDATDADVPNPGLKPFRIACANARGRYVRLTATRLFHRVDQYMVALSEFAVFNRVPKNLAIGASITSLDSIEAPVRWRGANLIDGIFPTQRDPENPERAALLEKEHAALMVTLETPELLAERKTLAEQLTAKEAELKKLPAGQKVYTGMVYKGSGSFKGRYGLGPRPIHVLHRGEVTQPGNAVGPGTVPVLPGVDWHFSLPEDHDESARRAALAEWITREDHPLTWRSIVNRVWQYHFGRGLVDSPNDFGRMGQPPTHPGLLDWLAVEFRDGGQSLKALHELIVTSSVYRQASTHNEAYAVIDGGNQFYWRMNRQRLDAESLRDNVLAMSGALDRKMYGPGFYLFALEKTAHSPHYEYHLYDPTDPTTHRRSVYRFVVRSQPDPFMTSLDCADSSQSTPKRMETITALQALSLMNNSFNLEMARRFAERVEREAPELKGQVARAYRLATGRAADEAQLASLTAYAERHGLVNLCRLMFNLNGFVYVD